MIRVLLSDKGSSSPHHWWYNYVQSIKGPNTQGVLARIDLINTDLMNWSANLWQHISVDAADSSHKNVYLDFYDEHAYTWFILRWS